MDSKKVMVVDDNTEILDFFKNAMEVLNYDSILAPNGIEALKLFKKEEPDIVFLDIKMPFIDGIETLSRMRHLDEDHKTVIIMLTGYGDLATARQALRLGAYDYVTKPINLNIVKDLCTDALKEQEKLCEACDA